MQTLHDVQSKTEVGELWITYLLFVLFFTAPIGAIISAVKLYQYKRQAQSGEGLKEPGVELLKSHYQWLLNTFAWSIAMGMAALGTLYYMFGFAIAAFAVVWWIYRLGRGMLALFDTAELPVSV